METNSSDQDSSKLPPIDPQGEVDEEKQAEEQADSESGRRLGFEDDIDKIVGRGSA